MNEIPVWKVSQVIPESHDVTSLELEAPPGVEIRRAPGQFATIRVRENKGWSKPHPFTISCDSDCDTLRFTIKSVGDFTSKIRDLRAGDEVRCDGPYGSFLKGADELGSFTMIAGGVGITPFLSLLRTLRRQKSAARMVLIWSNKTAADIFVRDELTAMTLELDLTVVHALTRETPPEAPPGSRVHYAAGRVNADMIARWADTTAPVFLCGPPPMQEAVLKELANLGIDPESVQREAFGA